MIKYLLVILKWIEAVIQLFSVQQRRVHIVTEVYPSPRTQVVYIRQSRAGSMYLYKCMQTKNNNIVDRAAMIIIASWLGVLKTKLSLLILLDWWPVLWFHNELKLASDLSQCFPHIDLFLTAHHNMSIDHTDFPFFFSFFFFTLLNV